MIAAMNTCSAWVGVGACVLLIVVPNVILAAWALRNPHESEPSE